MVQSSIESVQVKSVKRKLNPLQVDPSRTGQLRKRLGLVLQRRMGRISRSVAEHVEKKLTRFSGFVTNSWLGSIIEKGKQFLSWILGQFTLEFLTPTSEAEVNDLIELSYRQGMERGFTEFDNANPPQLQPGSIPPPGVPTPFGVAPGRPNDWLKYAFGQPVAQETIDMLRGRTQTAISNLTQSTAASMEQILIDGLTQGQSPRTIARTISQQLTDIGRKRALTIARTEVIRAQAEGQLVALEQLGVTEVGVMVEWSTTGDGRVCPKCNSLNGIVLKVVEAKGLLPRHPNCRCAWIPANVGESQRGQVRGAAAIQSILRKNYTGRKGRTK